MQRYERARRLGANGHCWIDGQPVPGTSDARHDLVDPATGQSFDTLSLAGPGDVDAAVQAARAAQPGWAALTPAARSGYLYALAKLLQERSAVLAETESVQTGKPIRLASEFDVAGTIDNAMFFAGACRHLEGVASAEYAEGYTSVLRREALGVIASIAPWNYPLQMAGWKVLPAIAAGNTVVLKPSELTPLTALLLARAAADAGIPDGVINVVTGTGPLVGQALADHPDVDMISFTGSTRAGQAVMATAARTVKRVHLELGGKAPLVVFDDGDLEAAARGAVAGALINTGQDCTAATRAIVHASLFEPFLLRVADLMRQVRLGDPFDADTDLGPLISLAHRDRVADMVDKAAGSRILCGGAVPEGRLRPGAFYPPTLVADVAASDALWREEVFGPVLVAVPFDTDDEAIALANDTPYALAASAWTSNVFRAQRAARELRAGCVWINDHIPIVSEMPHGGSRASGFGKDMSRYAFEEYTTLKHVMSEMNGNAVKPWHAITGLNKRIG
jgi:betaine-aldehyde dehydrogenase